MSVINLEKEKKKKKMKKKQERIKKKKQVMLIVCPHYCCFLFSETLEKKNANKLYWSPQGRFIILASLRSMSCQLEFYNAREMESMSTEEHSMASFIKWDPTGRYVASVVSHWHHPVRGRGDTIKTYIYVTFVLFFF